MKLKLLLTIFLLPLVCFSQEYNGKMYDYVNTKKGKAQTFETYQVFKTSISNARNEYSNAVSEGVVLDFDAASVATIIKNNPRAMSLEVPLEQGGKKVRLELIQKDIFSKDFQVSTSDGRNITDLIDRGKHFRGIIKGQKNSLVSISVFNNEIIGFIALNEVNYIVGKLKDSNTKHIIYKDKDLMRTNEFVCATEDDGIGYTISELQQPPANRDPADCVNIYIEAGQSVYNSFAGNLTNTMNFLNGVFAQSYVLYANDGMTLQTSSMFIWTTPDPYSGPDSASYRAQFQANTAQGGFNGDLGHLVEVDNVGGQAAGFSGICNPDTDESLCFSGFSTTNYNNVPTYSFNVNIIAHEMGHLLGSRHTHACVWNGNNTAIDGCSGFVEGLCALPPAANPGTIMSYCNPNISFVEGFHPQPTAVMLNNINAPSNCLSGCLAATNDLCADAININYGDTVSGSTTTATLDASIPSCLDEFGNSNTAPGVWYTFIGNGNLITLSTCNQANYDTRISVFTGDCTSLNCEAAVDDGAGCANFSTLLDLCTVNGTIYKVLIDGFGGATGDFDLTLTTSLNTAPVLTQNNTQLTDINQSSPIGATELISNFIAGSISDPDCSSLEGIALFNASLGNGQWQYNMGAGWNPVPNVTINSALLLQSDHSIRYIADGGCSETAEIQYFAWDRTTGTAGSLVDVSNRGGTSAFSVLFDNALINVTDDINPVATCTNITVSNDLGDCGAVVNFMLSATDNCPGVMIASIPPSGSVFPIGDSTVTVIALDNEGNSDQCTFVVTVNDDEDPVIDCPADITVNNDPGVCGAVVDFGLGFQNITFSQSFTQGVPSGDCGIWNTFQTQLLDGLPYTSVKLSGSNDPTGITLADPAKVLQLANALRTNTAVTIVDGPNTWRTGNCGPGTELSVNQNICQCDNPGFSIRPCIGNINWGGINSATCAGPTQTMTVEFIYNAGGGPIVGTDNCPGATTIQTTGLASGSVFPVGTTTNTFVVTDASGNTASCSFDVTVIDTESPVILCPADITQDTDPGVCEASVTVPAPTFTDNCITNGCLQSDDIESYTLGPILGQNSKWETWVPNTPSQSGEVSTEQAQSGSQSVKITGLPSGGPVDQTYRLGEITVGVWEVTYSLYVTPGNTAYTNIQKSEVSGIQWAHDIQYNSDGSAQYRANNTFTTFTYPQGAWFEVKHYIDLTNDVSEFFINGTSIISHPYVSGSDGLGTLSSIGAIDFFPTTNGFGVNGTEPNPSAIPLFYVDDVSLCAIPINDYNNTSDASDIYPLGSTNVVWTVTDATGNSDSCTQVITVEDNEDPVITCVPNGTRDTDPGVCEYTVVGTEFDATFTDNCTAGSITNDLNGTNTIAGEVLPLGDTIVVWTADDGHGQTATCTTVITVEDNEDPVITCVPNGTRDTDPGVCEYTVVGTEFDATFTDNCTAGSITNDLNGTDTIAGEVLPLGDTIVVWIVDDGHGQTATCTTLITVEDNELPIIACPADVNTNTDPGICGAEVFFADAIAIDNCGIDTVLQTAGLPSGSIFPVGVSIVEFTATDVNGNSSVCSFSITVTDNEDPLAVCQDITIQLDEFGNASITVADIDGGSSDNCAIDTITASQTDFDCSHVGPNDVTLTVTDIYGNVSTCIAVVTVEDVTNPVAVCQNITVALDENGTITITGADVDGGSTDACGIATYELDIDTFDCSNVGENIVVLTVTDVNGNVSTCTAIVTVEDNTDPVLVCMDITVELDENGQASITAEDVIASNTDACGILTTAVDISDFSCDDIGDPIMVTVFSADVNGNLSSCTAFVTVVDLLAPVIENCPEDQTVDPGPNNLFYELPDYWTLGATATDNCTDPVTILGQDPAPGTLLPDGVYTITLTAEDEYGNVGTCTFELTVESLLGIGDNDDISTILMYPNPAQATVNIRNPQAIALTSATIYDMTGKLIKTYDLNGMGVEKSLDVSQLATATYMVIIQSDNGSIYRQLIKE